MERSGPAFFENDNEAPEAKKKDGALKRLFSEIPGIIGLDKEEGPSSEPTERAFSLSFLGSPEADPAIMQPHEAEPATVVEPETYNPHRDDEISPHQAFEQLTGVEPAKAQSLEQERRFEVKDDPSKVPASYSQVDTTAPASTPTSSPVQSAPQAQRSTLITLGATPHVSRPKQVTLSQNQTYRNAILFGVVAAVVVLIILLIITQF